MIELFLATRNRHKIQEISNILGDSYRYHSFLNTPQVPEVIEDAGSFTGNAIKKAFELATFLALTGSQKIHYGSNSFYVIADDSGLEVDALGGAPGVYSARFAAEEQNNPTQNTPDKANNEKLLRLLKDVPEAKRSARFKCVIAMTPVIQTGAQPTNEVCLANEMELATEIFEGACEGRICSIGSGSGGFGYDPLFIPDGYSQTYAQLGEAIKNQLSHRAKALFKLKPRLDQLSASANS